MEKHEMDLILKKELTFKVMEIYGEKKLDIKKIIGKKIDALTDTNTFYIKPFDDLFNHLKEGVSNFEIWRQPYFQFPNYIISFQLPSKYLNENKVELRQSLVVCISLLVDYYTVFFEEVYYFLEFGNKKPSSHTIHFYESTSSLKILFDLEFINNSIVKYFPQKKFMSHYFLKNYKIKGYTPYGITEIPDNGSSYYSFYEFLFDTSNNLSSVEVVG